MKTALYAIFALLSISVLVVAPAQNAQAFFFFGNDDEESKPAEVKDLNDETDQGWFWQQEAQRAPTPRIITTPHIALLLPLTGQFAPAAQAVRDGFISAYYKEQQSNPHSQIDVRIYDTVADQDIKHAYTTARAEGANMIVGPLTKPGLEALLEGQHIEDVTTIALNTTEAYTHTPSQLYEFSLNPIDEAHRLAQQAFDDGHRYAMGLVQDDAFGTRALMAFKQGFEALGGQVVDVVYFDASRALEDPVRYSLNIDTSQARAKKLQQTLGRSIESQMRHRQDMDFIFLVARPAQARQLPPLLKFYYADNVPIYATSSVYAGTPNKTLDSDLNGIVFCDSPWMLNPAARNPVLSVMAIQLLQDPATQDRLFALGVDAFEVARQISTLRSRNQFIVEGVTGKLTMDQYQRITRAPICARFVAGIPNAL